MASDRLGRTLDYVRVSLTDACNFRCLYCMPESLPFRPARRLLTNEELMRLLRIFAGLGFRKIRFTGGEPTLRDRLPEIVEHTLALPGVTEVGLTTNGSRLKALARPLVHAGLQRVNISLNTLNSERFAAITRGGVFQDTWEGLLEAEREGLGIKINAVILKAINDQEDPVELARLTLDHPWQVRFIESMPLGGNGQAIPEATVAQRLREAFGELEPVRETNLNTWVRLMRLPGAAGAVGFISPHSHPFCNQCTRARLTADGHLRLCLLLDDETDLLTPLRVGENDRQLIRHITAALAEKPPGHRLADRHAPCSRVMSEIGG